MVFKWVLITCLKVYLVSLPVAWKAFVRYLYIKLGFVILYRYSMSSHTSKSELQLHKHKQQNWLDV